MSGGAQNQFSPQKSNYILIGMPASGKSTTARLLAGQLKRRFLDTDNLLKTVTGHTPSELMAQCDFAAFVRCEEEAVCTLEGERLVIATGGSVVYSPVAMAHLRDMGTIIYLYETLRNIRRRVGTLDERGVIARPGQSFAEVYDERCRLYSHYADITWQNLRFPPWRSAAYLALLLNFLKGCDGGESHFGAESCDDSEMHQEDDLP